ncbi:hypothetical protein HN51_019963 [Arachis hypogaea]
MKLSLHKDLKLRRFLLFVFSLLICCCFHLLLHYAPLLRRSPSLATRTSPTPHTPSRLPVPGLLSRAVHNRLLLPRLFRRCAPPPVSSLSRTPSLSLMC